MLTAKDFSRRPRVTHAVSAVTSIAKCGAPLNDRRHFSFNRLGRISDLTCRGCIDALHVEVRLGLFPPAREDDDNEFDFDRGLYE